LNIQVFSNDTELENAFYTIRRLTERRDENYIHGIDNKTKRTSNIKTKNDEILDNLQKLRDCMNSL